MKTETFDDVHAFILLTIISLLSRVLINYGANKGKSISELLSDTTFIGQKLILESKALFSKIGLLADDINISLSLDDKSLDQIRGLAQQVSFDRTEDILNIISQMGDEVGEKSRILEDKIHTLEKHSLLLKYINWVSNIIGRCKQRLSLTSITFILLVPQSPSQNWNPNMFDCFIGKCNLVFN